MNQETNYWDDEDLVTVLRQGGVAVMPTDTVYGIVGSALRIDTVERIYTVRKRSPDKPCIILIADQGQLDLFTIHASPEQTAILSQSWPGPVSVILGCNDTAPEQLHRGTFSLAFRLPANDSLRALLRATGPLIAPSANTEGDPTATTIDEARNYFHDLVDIYIDGGTIIGSPSRVIRVSEGGEVEVLRA